MASSSKPKQTAPAAAYVPPTIQQPVYTPPPPSPAPDAPTPLYQMQEAEAAQKGDTQAKNLSRAKVGRASLKINLVNSGGDATSSGINTTN